MLQKLLVLGIVIVMVTAMVVLNWLDPGSENPPASKEWYGNHIKIAAMRAKQCREDARKGVNMDARSMVECQRAKGACEDAFGACEKYGYVY